MPLVTARERNGIAMPVSLLYDSQNWRQDGGVNWQLAADTGQGVGWRAMIGSITPYSTQLCGGVPHYVFTDGTGAEYRLDVNTGGVWTSTSGAYVWYDAAANILHFKDGSFWVMGCTSGGSEGDAGTMYPTVVEDSNGNQVLVSYKTGAGLPMEFTNSSSAIASIEDVRGKGSATYTFASGVNGDGSRGALASIANGVSSGESFTFGYGSAGLVQPPYGVADSTFTVTAKGLVSVTWGLPSTPAAAIKVPARPLKGGPTVF